MAKLLHEALSKVDPRPAPETDRYQALYVRAFLGVRAVIGILAVLLPLVLVFADDWLFSGHPVPRDSLSRYYYSGMREWFVGSLAASGAFLIAYKASERSLDNYLSLAAGAAAALIALFPTGRPSETPPIPLNPLQDLIGEGWVKAVHFGASGVFIVSLGLVTVFFGIREGRRHPRVDTKHTPGFWRAYHFACAAAIAAAILWIVITMGFGIGPRWSLLLGEWVSCWAFGLSWALKGLEMDTLRGRPKPETTPLVPYVPRAPLLGP